MLRRALRWPEAGRFRSFATVVPQLAASGSGALGARGWRAVGYREGAELKMKEAANCGSLSSAKQRRLGCSEPSNTICW